MGFFDRKTTKNIDQTTNLTTIETDNRQAKDQAIIGGEGNITVTDGGIVGDALDFTEKALGAFGGRAFKTVDRTVDQGFDLATDSVFAVSTLADRFGERNSELVNDTLGRESLLTSQVLSKLGSSFENGLSSVQGGSNAALETITGALNNVGTAADKTDKLSLVTKAIMAVALIGGAVYIIPKLKKG